MNAQRLMSIITVIVSAYFSKNSKNTLQKACWKYNQLHVKIFVNVFVKLGNSVKLCQANLCSNIDDQINT